MDDFDDFPSLLSNAIDKIRIYYRDTNNFIEKIDQTSNNNEKLKILLQFLGNGLPTPKLFIDSDKIDQFLHRVFLITNECPTNFNSFMKWFPNFIIGKNKYIISIQKRVSRLQLHIKELLDLISAFNILDNIDSFKEKESKIYSDLQLPEENEISEYGNDINDNHQATDDINVQFIKNDKKITEIGKTNESYKNEFENMQIQIEMLNKQNKEHQIQIQNSQLKIDNLLKELSNKENQKQKIEELETSNLNLKKLFIQNETKYQSIITSLKQKLKKQNQIMQERKKIQDESNKPKSNTNFELTQLKILLTKSQKENEVYKSHFKDLMSIFNSQSITENDTNNETIEKHFEFIKNKILQLKEENIKNKFESDKIKNQQNILIQKVHNLETSFTNINEENQQLKNELHSFENLNSSSIYETIDKLKTQNEELRKSFLKISQNNFNKIKGNNNDKILKSVSTSTSYTQLNEFNGNSYTSQISDNSVQSVSLSNICDNQSAYHDKEIEINCLKKKIVALEAEKIKLADSLKKVQLNKNPESKNIDMKKIGFLLADALCQRYNPSRVSFEIKRLIEIVRSEHIKLSESVRVPLDPFDHFIDEPKIISDEIPGNNQKKNLFSGFDELDCQISAMKSYL